MEAKKADGFFLCLTEQEEVKWVKFLILTAKVIKIFKLLFKGVSEEILEI